MIFLRTGVPGAGKTLNSLKEICSDPSVTQKTKFYHNIKAFLLDLDFCNSFQGFFYGVYWPSIQDTPKQKKYIKIIKEVHSEERLVEITDLPWLAPKFQSYDEAAAIQLFISWCRKCYPQQNLKALNEYLIEVETLTIESIKMLGYHWTHTDNPTQWPDLPNGSICLFDECQDFFSPMNSSAKRPAHYTKFQTHRHTGTDIHLVTQHFSFLDSVIRNCVGNHVHFFRPFGSSIVSRLQRDKIFNTDRKDECDQTQKSRVNRDKKYYGVYWSADEHTAKFKMPKVLVE